MDSHRRKDAQRRLEMAEASARAEATSAQRLIDDFVSVANERGIRAESLEARTMSGQRVKTDKRGWYLRQNKSLAVGTDGGYYVLTVAGGFFTRFTGVKLAPTQPSLQVGRGGRDGETGELHEFLKLRLADG